MSRAIISIFYTLTIFRLPAKYKQETDMIYDTQDWRKQDYFIQNQLQS